MFSAERSPSTSCSRRHFLGASAALVAVAGPVVAAPCPTAIERLWPERTAALTAYVAAKAAEDAAFARSEALTPPVPADLWLNATDTILRRTPPVHRQAFEVDGHLVYRLTASGFAATAANIPQDASRLLYDAALAERFNRLRRLQAEHEAAVDRAIEASGLDAASETCSDALDRLMAAHDAIMAATPETPADVAKMAAVVSWGFDESYDERHMRALIDGALRLAA